MFYQPSSARAAQVLQSSVGRPSARTAASLRQQRQRPSSDGHRPAQAWDSTHGPAARVGPRRAIGPGGLPTDQPGDLCENDPALFANQPEVQTTIYMSLVIYT